MAEYGLSYMGSKGSIVNQFAHLFPKADNFYDLFGGGFSVSHYMIQRRGSHYKKFHFNEIRPGISDLVRRSIAGEYNYNKFKPPWISREDFHKNKATDAYTKIIWSFGNGGNSYIFGENIEPYKKSMHMCVVFGEFDEIAKTVTGLTSWPDKISIKGRRLFIRNRIEFYSKTKIPELLKNYLSLQRLQRLERLEQLEQLQRLERLQQLEQLEQLEQLHYYSVDYKEVPIEKNSVIYCDIPYAGTTEYEGGFNHKEFFDWAHSQKEKVFISEYEITDKRFTLVKEIKKISLLSSKSREVKYERIYTNH